MAGNAMKTVEATKKRLAFAVIVEPLGELSEMLLVDLVTVEPLGGSSEMVLVHRDMEVTHEFSRDRKSGSLSSSGIYLNGAHLDVRVRLEYRTDMRGNTRVKILTSEGESTDTWRFLRNRYIDLKGSGIPLAMLFVAERNGRNIKTGDDLGLFSVLSEARNGIEQNDLKQRLLGSTKRFDALSKFLLPTRRTDI